MNLEQMNNEVNASETRRPKQGDRPF